VAHFYRSAHSVADGAFRVLKELAFVLHYRLAIIVDLTVLNTEEVCYAFFTQFILVSCFVIIWIIDCARS